jgi:hypothetical protein
MVGAGVRPVIVNIMRRRPGLGDTPQPGHYHRHTKDFGHGDKKAITLAPSTVQEAWT